MMAPAAISQSASILKRCEGYGCHCTDGDGPGGAQGYGGQRHRRRGDGPDDGRAHALEKRAGVGVVLDASQERTGAEQHEHERWQEDCDGGDHRSDPACRHVADERCRGHDGAGRRLAECYPVEELLVGQPTELLHGVALDQGDQDVAAAEEQCAGLQEDPDQGGQGAEVGGPRGRWALAAGAARRPRPASAGTRASARRGGRRARCRAVRRRVGRPIRRLGKPVSAPCSPDRSGAGASR